YYGQKRGQMVQTQSTLNQRAYARLVDVGGQLRDQRVDQAKEKDQFRNLVTDGDGSVNAGRSIAEFGVGARLYSLGGGASNESISVKSINALPINGRAAQSLYELRPSG